jgi:hypothetical protein
MIEDVPKILVSERMLGFEAQRRTDACLRLVEAPEAVEYVPKIVVCVGKVRLQA